MNTPSFDFGRIFDSLDKGIEGFFGVKAAQAANQPQMYPYGYPYAQHYGAPVPSTYSASPSWLMPVLMAGAGVALVYALTD
ncbi:MAG TPA: hypothetical protein VGN75_03775 [Kaistia sp.]|jgi:hypothetical protein|nr:hypothetical protein [Kaistia sp.]